MKMVNKPTLFIDFDGTICFDRFWRSAEKPVKAFIKQFLFKDNQPLLGDWMRAVHTSEDINKTIAEASGFDYNDLWEGFVDDCKNMHVEPSTLKLIDSARSKFNTILMTDNMDCFDRFTAPALSLHKYFDKIANSYNYKASKGDDGGLLFRLVAEEQGIDLSEAIFIDNSKGTCELFETFGKKSHLVKHPEDIERVLIEQYSI